MHTRAKLAEFAPQQFCTAVACDVAQAVIGVPDGAIGIRHADNGMLIQRKLLLVQRATGELPLTHQGRRLVDHIHQALNFQRGVVDHQFPGAGGTRSKRFHRFSQQYQPTQPTAQCHANKYQTNDQTGKPPTQCQQGHRPKAFGHKRHVELQTQDAVVFATHRDVAVHIVKRFLNPLHQPARCSALGFGQVFSTHPSATDVDKHGRRKLRPLHTFVEDFLYRIKVPNDHAILNRLSNHLNQHDRRKLRFLHLLVELVFEKQPKPATHKHQQGDGVQREHPVGERRWNQTREEFHGLVN